MRLILAAGRRRLLSRARGAARRTAARVVYFGEADFQAKVKLYGGAGAGVPDSGARAVGLGARGGDGVRHAGGRPRSRPRFASRGRSVTGLIFNDLEEWSVGCRRVFDLDRRRVHERAWPDSAPSAWSTSTSPSTPGS